MSGTAFDDGPKLLSGLRCRRVVSQDSACANRCACSFVVAGRVLNKHTLKTIFVAMSGVLGTVGPVLIALHEVPVDRGTDPCTLDAAQREKLATYAALLVHNDTCTLNITFN